MIYPLSILKSIIFSMEWSSQARVSLYDYNLETLNGLRDANVMCPGGGSRPHAPRERGVLEEVRAAPSALHPRRPRLAR